MVHFSKVNLNFQIVIVSICIFLRISVKAHAGDYEGQILDKIFQNYSNNVRPSGKGSTIVFVNIYLRSLDSVDDFNREFSVQITLRQEWKDARLTFANSSKLKKGYLSLQNVRMLWIPDLFFRNEKWGHIHEIITPNVFARIFPDGNILYSIRLSLTLSCPMTLNNFPFDSQNCSMRMASYGMAADDIIYKWRNNDPVQISSSLDFTKFSLKNFEIGNCDTKTNTGLYSCIRLDLFLKRHFSYYFIQVYIPCTSLVILVWLSFWLDSKEIVARLLITVITYLVMIIAVSLLNYNLPRTLYTKAIDIWTGICLTFVFIAFCETIIVNFLWLKTSEETKRGIDSGIAIEESLNLNGIRILFEKQILSKKLDIVFRVVYPVAFILFVCIYFAVY